MQKAVEPTIIVPLIHPEQRKPKQLKHGRNTSWLHGKVESIMLSKETEENAVPIRSLLVWYSLVGCFHFGNC